MGRLSAGPPEFDQLGHDTDGDLFGGIGADLLADRRVHLVEQVPGHAFFLQFLPHQGDLAPAADHADIGGAGPHRLLNDGLVPLVSAGHRDQVGRAVDGQLAHDLVEGVHDHLVGFGKPLMVRESRPVVHHDDAEPDGIGEPGYGPGHVAAAEKEQLRRRPDGLQEDSGLHAFVLQRDHPQQVLGDFQVRIQPDPIVQGGVSERADGLARIGE